MKHITATELSDWLSSDDARAQVQLLDVREPWEAELASIGGSLLMPLASVPERFAELDRARPVVCICHHGMRSAQAGLFLERQGFLQTINLTGGIDAWSRLVDNSVASY